MTGNVLRIAAFSDGDAGGNPAGVVIGAHPSYPDREHFGRRAVDMPVGALRDALLRGKVRRVKPGVAQFLKLRHFRPAEPGIGAITTQREMRRRIGEIEGRE